MQTSSHVAWSDLLLKLSLGWVTLAATPFAHGETIALSSTRPNSIGVTSAYNVVNFSSYNINGGTALQSKGTNASMTFSVSAPSPNVPFSMNIRYTSPTGDGAIAMKINNTSAGNFSLPKNSYLNQFENSSNVQVNLASGTNTILLTTTNSTPVIISSINLSPSSSQVQPTLVDPTGDTWLVTMDDEFNTGTLNPEVWSPFSNQFPAQGDPFQTPTTRVIFGSDFTFPAGSFNNLYMPGNVVCSQQNPGLQLRADNIAINIPNNLPPNYVNPPQARFTSGLISSYGSFDQAYGFFEMKGQMPGGDGFWPAFWLMPQDRTWDYEIDIFEILPGLTTDGVHQGLIWDSGAHSEQGWWYSSLIDVTKPHIYGMLWKPGTISWFVDGVETRTYSGTGIPQVPMYVIANLGVGGAWPGYPNETSEFPAYMDISYIRVWQYQGAPAPAYETQFPVLIGNVQPKMLTAKAGSTITFNVGVDSQVASTDSWMLSYSLHDVDGNPQTLWKYGDLLSGKVAPLATKIGSESVPVTITIPADYPTGQYVLKATIDSYPQEQYHDGGSVAIVNATTP
jgi:beta-glucanase (GH16 family)